MPIQNQITFLMTAFVCLGGSLLLTPVAFPHLVLLYTPATHYRLTSICFPSLSCCFWTAAIHSSQRFRHFMFRWLRQLQSLNAYYSVGIHSCVL